MRVVLFGGKGYLGQHVELALKQAGGEKNEVVVIGRGENAPLSAQGADCFIHLACPRNKPGVWSWRKAYEAQETASLLWRWMKPKRALFISSMSVYDNPENDYQHFKLMAEREVLALGWTVFRLPTLLGARTGLHYRRDLGLHQIATALAFPSMYALPTVNGNVVRHVAPIDDVVVRICSWCLSTESCPRVQELGCGVVSFEGIVPPTVRVVSEPAFTTTCGSPMDYTSVRYLRMSFEKLVERIRAGEVTPC